MLEGYSEQSRKDCIGWLNKLKVGRFHGQKTICCVCNKGDKDALEDFLIGFADKRDYSYWFHNVEFRIFELGSVESVVGLQWQQVILFNNPKLDYDTFLWLKSRFRGHRSGRALFVDIVVGSGYFYFWQY